jgi:hypothetical protein
MEKLQDELTTWDKKKLSKVWAQLAQGKLIAANFDVQ